MIKFVSRFVSTLKVENPYTFETIGEVPLISLEEAYNRLDSSQKFQESWSTESLSSRSSVVNRALSFLDSKKDELSEEITSQTGKPYAQSLEEIDYTIKQGEVFLSMVSETLKPQEIPSESNYKRINSLAPVGVVMMINTYTQPLSWVTLQCILAVLAGNTVLLKPSPYAPLISNRVCEAFGNSELVQDCFTTNYDLNLLIKESDIDLVTFSGSYTNAHEILKAVSKQKIMEFAVFLKNNNIAYVAQDADLNSAARKICKSAMRNTGQSLDKCGKVLVDSEKTHEFLEILETLVRTYCIGNPMELMTTLGPLTVPDLPYQLTDKIQTAVSENRVEVVCGGTALYDEHGKGRFFEPTILKHINRSIEIDFGHGPILEVCSVSSIDEALKIMNESEDSCLNAVFTNDSEVVKKFEQNTKTGLIVNECEESDVKVPRGLTLRSGNAVKFGVENFKIYVDPRPLIYKL